MAAFILHSLMINLQTNVFFSTLKFCLARFNILTNKIMADYEHSYIRYELILPLQLSMQNNIT